MTIQSNSLPWYGLRVKSRHEQVATAVLRAKGYDPFSPSYRVQRRWTDRIKETELPLFPGYVFCRLNVADRLPVLMSAGVIGIVGIGKMPVPIEESEMEAIRAVMRSGLPALPWPFVHPGDSVRVEFGPLRGVQGVVEGVNDQQRLVVSVALLQRSISVALDPNWVTAQPLRHRPTCHPLKGLTNHIGAGYCRRQSCRNSDVKCSATADCCTGQ
jgi:transcription antitermination factor NusG